MIDSRTIFYEKELRTCVDGIKDFIIATEYNPIDGFYTRIHRMGRRITVERYNTLNEAKEGHRKWRKLCEDDSIRERFPILQEPIVI